MRPLISITAGGGHDPDWHWMKVGNRGLLVDLSLLLDRAIAKVEWGKDAEGREFGRVTMTDGTARIVTDKNFLKPALIAYEQRSREIAQAQAEHDVAQPVVQAPE